MEKEHNTWIQTNENSNQQDAYFTMMEHEKRYFRELAMLEEEITKQRLHNLKRMEEFTKEHMDIVNKVESNAKELLEKSESHVKERLEAAMLSHKHREMGEVTDMLTRAKLEKLYTDTWRKEKLSEVVTSLRLQNESIDHKNEMIAGTWRREDDEARLEGQIKVELAKQRMKNQIENNIGLLLEERAMNIHRNQEEKILELERQRNLRFIREKMQNNELNINTNTNTNNNNDKNNNNNNNSQLSTEIPQLNSSDSNNINKSLFFSSQPNTKDLLQQNKYQQSSTSLPINSKPLSSSSPSSSSSSPSSVSSIVSMRFNENKHQQSQNSKQNLITSKSNSPKLQLDLRSLTNETKNQNQLKGNNNILYSDGSSDELLLEAQRILQKTEPFKVIDTNVDELSHHPLGDASELLESQSNSSNSFNIDRNKNQSRSNQQYSSTTSHYPNPKIQLRESSSSYYQRSVPFTTATTSSTSSSTTIPILISKFGRQTVKNTTNSR